MDMGVRDRVQSDDPPLKRNESVDLCQSQPCDAEPTWKQLPWSSSAIPGRISPKPGRSVLFGLSGKVPAHRE